MVVRNEDKRGRNKEKEGRGFRRLPFFYFLLFCWFFSCLFNLVNVFRSKFCRFLLYSEYATSYETIIFHHGNARPHVAIPVKNYLENSEWEVLPHLPYSPDLAPSDYHLFRSMQIALTGIRFTSEQGIKNLLNSLLAAKLVQPFSDGIHKLPERWEEVIALDGQYFK